MAGTKRYDIDMVNGPLAGKIIRFALPLMAASIIQLFFNAADVMVVGKFVGDASQAAVTSTASLVTLMVNLFLGLGVGVNVTVARALGEGNTSRIGAVVHTAVTMSFLAGIMMMLIGEVFAPAVLRLMGSPENIIGLSVLYLRIYFIGLPGELVYNFGSALLRARGDTRRPMYYLTTAGVINVLLNLIFVILFRWDVAGVAAATIISKYISAGLVIRCLMHESGTMHFDPARLGIDFGVMKDICRVGVPAGLQASMFAIANVTIQASVNSMGDIVMAGSGAASNVNGFVYTTGNAFYHSCMTFASQNYGAGKPERVDRVYGWCVLFGMVFPLVIGGSVCLFGPQVLSLYSSDPAVIEAGMHRLLMASGFNFLAGFMEATSGVLRGLGRSMLPMIVTLVGTCGLRIAWVFTVFPIYRTPGVLFACMPISWVVTGSVLFISFFVVRKKAYARIGERAAK